MEQHCLIRVVQAHRQVQQVVFPGIAGSLVVLIIQGIYGQVRGIGQRFGHRRGVLQGQQGHVLRQGTGPLLPGQQTLYGQAGLRFGQFFGIQHIIAGHAITACHRGNSIPGVAKGRLQGAIGGQSLQRGQIAVVVF